MGAVAASAVEVLGSTQAKGLAGILVVEASNRSIAMLPLLPESDCGGGGGRPPRTFKYGGPGDEDPEGFEEGEEPIVENLAPEGVAAPLVEHFPNGYCVRRLPVPREL